MATEQFQKLVEDLTNAFFRNYEKGHIQCDEKDYEGYFLGLVILTSDRATIDGQQYLSAITLLFIYLNHLQVGFQQQVNIDSLIFSAQYGEKNYD